MIPKVVPATRKHAVELWPRLRDADVKEVWASNHATPEFAVMASFETTPEPMAIVYEDGPVIAIFGCSRGSKLTGMGIPWLLGTDEITRIAREFLRQSRPYISGYLDQYRILENHVMKSNRVSVRWLKWCGFTMDKAKPYGPDGSLFHRFHAKRGEI